MIETHAIASMAETNPIAAQDYTTWLGAIKKLQNDLQIGLNVIDAIEDPGQREEIGQEIRRFLKTINTCDVSILANQIATLNFGDKKEQFLYFTMMSIKNKLFLIIGKPDLIDLHGDFVLQLKNFTNGLEQLVQNTPSKKLN